jgi:hypothetical protein
VYEESHSVADNTSTVKWEIWVDAGNGYFTNRQLYRKAIVNGVTVVDETAAASVSNYGSTMLASGTQIIGHDSDGSKTITASAEIASSGSWTNPLGTASCSLTLQLSTIPRASVPSINTWPNNSPDFNIGDTITIHMNRKSTAYTHTVIFKYGSTSVTVGTSIADNVTYNTSNIAAALLARCASTDQTSGTVEVKTYNGGTLISTQSCAYTAHVPAGTYHPTCTIAKADSNATTAALTGSSSRMVKGYSNLQLTLTIGHNDSSHTTLDHAEVVVGSTLQTISLTGTSATKTVTFTAVKASKATVKVYDARGIKYETSTTWTLVEYIPPSINLVTGRTGNTLESVETQATGQLWRGSFGASSNSASITYYRRLKGASSWTQCSGSGTPTANTSHAYSLTRTLSETFSTGSEYQVYAVITDALTSATSATVTVFQALPLFALFKDHADVFGVLHIHDRTDPDQMLTVSASDSIARVAVASGSLTTPANNGADLTLTLSREMKTTSYAVAVTRAGNPNGFDQVSYTVTGRTKTTVTIHSWNAYGASVTQNLLVIAAE